MDPADSRRAKESRSLFTRPADSARTAAARTFFREPARMRVHRPYSFGSPGVPVDQTSAMSGTMAEKRERKCLAFLVGVTGFEPATYTSRTCANIIQECPKTSEISIITN